MFKSEIFKEYLARDDFGNPLLFFEQIDSTNIYAKSNELAAAEEGTVIFAELQTRGRGQYARSFVMEPRTGLTFTLLLRPKEASRLTLLTVACAYSILQVIEDKIPDSEIKIKWPNDLLVNRKKILGILTETVFSGNKLDRLIIGMGLNVNQTDFDEKYAGKATSLALESGEKLSREKLLAAILKQLKINYEAWKNKSRELVHNINLRMEGYGEWVILEIDGKEVPGRFKFLGINEAGQLQVLNEELEIKVFSYEQIRIKVD